MRPKGIAGQHLGAALTDFAGSADSIASADLFVAAGPMLNPEQAVSAVLKGRLATI